MLEVGWVDVGFHQVKTNVNYFFFVSMPHLAEIGA